jgi:FAD/FMN-containing dehydrogenase
VVTGFHLQLHDRPAVITNSVQLYPIDLLDDVYTWAHAIGPDVAREMELMLFIHRDAAGAPEIAVTGPVLAASQARADAAAAMLDSCPVRGQATLALTVPVTMDDLYAGAHAAYPDEHRYAVDNMWTHVPIADLLPGLHAFADALPGGTSHLLWMNWGPCEPARPDMAFSVEDQTYLAAYAVWADVGDDAAGIAWATETMRTLEPQASGIQLADENLGRRPARFVSDANLARLDAIRADSDPDGVFHPWMGRL